MKRRFWAGLLFFVMLWSLLPASALAANEEAELETEVSTSENSPVQVKKTINGDGTKLTLEAYVTNEVTQTSSTKPLDIVLVLDQSGSMADDFNGNKTGKYFDTCQYAMKQAVNSFIDKVGEQYSEKGDHRMAIVTFGSKAETWQGWTVVDAAGKSSLKKAVDRLPQNPAGATNVGAGMQAAETLMGSGYAYAGSSMNRQKVVIVFTDGVPTTGTEFNTAVANAAISSAKKLKDAGTAVYTVGIFNGANPAQLHGDKFDRAAVKDNPCNGNVGEYWGYTNVNAWFAGGSESIRGLDIAATNRFLNFLSSNFTGATEIGIKEASHGLVGGQAWEITKNFNRTASDYYLTAKDSDSLNNMFQQIIQEISKLEIKADKNAVLSDTLSEYFALNVPEGTDAANAITAEKRDCTGKNSDGNYTWKKADTQPEMTIKVTDKTINVIGFDYTKNAVTATTTKEGVTTYSGAELIVTIPIKPDTNCKAWRPGENAYVTNDTVTNKAGLSGYTDKKGETSLETVLSDSPEAMVTAYTVTYEVTGEAPETADYTDPRAYIKGQTADVLNAPKSPVEKEGFKYTFDGWMNGTEKAGKTIDIVDHDVTLTGAWSKEAIKPAEYELKYEWNGGAATANASYTLADSYAAGAVIDVPTEDEAVYKDHTFAGWYTDKELTQPWTGTTMPAHDLTLYAKWEENTPDPTTGSVVITKQVEGVDDADIAQIKELTFNVKKGDEIVKNGSLHYDGTKLTTATINLEEGSYNLSEDLDKAMNAIPGYELVGVRFVETFAESEPDTQAATDDTATTAFSDYRFEIKTSDSAIFVTCINTYEKKEVEPDTYTVTYTDGANGSAFDDQVYRGLSSGDKTPKFEGTPARSGYTFNGWTPAVAETVTGNATYTATWTKNSGGHDSSSDTYYLAIKKIDAQDGHVLKDAKFGLYVDAKQIATATSGSKGYARFSLDERVYDKLDKNDDLYVMELTAPDGYVKSSRKYDVSVNDFVKNNVIGAQKQAITVTNSRSSTPDRLNDEDHFAYVIGYKDGNVRPYGLISRAETTTIFFRLLKDSVRDGNLLTSNTYTDVADNYWANTAISTMTGLGIVQGRTATTFDPYAPITRAQFAAICARFDDGKTQGGQTFTDIQGHWAQAYIERAAELGWIKGFEDGTFRPDTYITRAQAMTMINRVLNRIPEDADDLLSNMNVWPDCNPGDWFYLAVHEATNSHDYKHKAGNYETWSSMNKDPDWTRYEN
nr:S-layer homology domain-containing protein [uncultured Dysosmobacter sp.]